MMRISLNLLTTRNFPSNQSKMNYPKKYLKIKKNQSKLLNLNLKVNQSKLSSYKIIQILFRIRNDR